MAYTAAREYYANELQSIREQGLYKEERFIHSPQAADIVVEYPAGAPMKKVINFCANNYLGLSSHPAVIEAAHKALDSRGYGMSSVRFICGTQDLHKQLEAKITEFLKTEDTILFASCLDANAAIFEGVLTDKDATIADRLVHASMVDGIRLCKAQQFNYKHLDFEHLEEKLKEASETARFKMVITDGAFSMDGDVTPMDKVVELAEKYDAMVMFDDAHCTGFIGKHGRGTHEHFNVMGKVDAITSTLGKAMGGASGGFVSGRKELVELLRQRGRPYLFSNSVPPMIAAGGLKVLELLSTTTDLRDKLEKNTKYFRKKMTEAGFGIKEGFHPIVPIMLYNAKLAQDFSRDLYNEGIYVIGFFFPVVAKGLARIRVQLSAGHEMEHIDKAIVAFTKIGKKYDILGKTKDQIIEKYGL